MRRRIRGTVRGKVALMPAVAGLPLDHPRLTRDSQADTIQPSTGGGMNRRREWCPGSGAPF